uniref:Reverse transcriptase domain-containing protein n=1 Tax=Tanacetum cinerariifolium TaxID=118510 RepID=A0A699GZD9_TANCI|nr:hypothetical protein [Tanacetum cinerariifolium]
MEEMLYKFIDEGKREHEEMRTFICEFLTTNEIFFKERNNSLSELRFEVQELLKPSSEKQTPPVPFPRILRKEKEEAQYKKFLENLKQLYINLPFIKALTQMPKYTKFSKDLGASISLISYTMYEKLGLGESKPTRMSLELAERSIQYPRGIIVNVLIKFDKFVLPIDFVIFDMPEDSRVPITLKRPFLAIARAMIDVFNKKITLRVRDDEGLEKSIDHSYLESFESFECKVVDDSDSGEPIRRIHSINTSYPVAWETVEPNKAESNHPYLVSTNMIDEKKPELKFLPHHLEYVYLHGDKSFPITISSELSKKCYFCKY